MTLHLSFIATNFSVCFLGSVPKEVLLFLRTEMQCGWHAEDMEVAWNCSQLC